MEERVGHWAIGLEHVLTETFEQLRTADVPVRGALAFLGLTVRELLSEIETDANDVISLGLITWILLADNPDSFVEIHDQSLASSESRRAFWASVPTVRRSQPVMP